MSKTNRIGLLLSQLFQKSLEYKNNLIQNESQIHS